LRFFSLPYKSRGPLSFQRKPESAVRPGGDLAALGPTPTAPQRTLASLLEAAYGGAEAANAVLEQALALTGRERLPWLGPDLVAFVRAHLMTTLTEQIGARLTLALLDDLVGQLDPSGIPPPPDSAAPPSSVPRPVARIAMSPVSSPRIRPMSLAVLLVDEDRVGRATLARALLRAEMNVSVIETLDELLTTLAAGDPIDALLMDAAHPEAQAMIETLIGRRPGVAVVTRTSDAGRTRALLGQLAVTKFDVRSREAPGEELIDAVKRLVGG